MALRKIEPSESNIRWLIKAGKALLPYSEEIADNWLNNYVTSKERALPLAIAKKLFHQETFVLFSAMANNKIDDYLDHLEDLGSYLLKENVPFSSVAFLIHFLEEAYFPILSTKFSGDDFVAVLTSIDHLLHNGFSVLSTVYFSKLEKASQRLSALWQITEAGLSTLSLNELLQELICRMVAITKADAGIVWIINERTQTLKPAASKNISSRYMPFFTMKVGEYLAGTIARRGVPMTLKELPIPKRAQFYIEEQGIKSMLGVPIKAENKVIGVARLDYKNDREFKKEDIELFEVLADRASIAIQNSRLFEQQKDIATVLQKSLRPAEPPLVNIDIGIVYQSATEAALVGGDFYDFIQRGQYLHLIIGDVSGRGIETAIEASMVKYAFRLLISEKTKPAELLYRLNNSIIPQLSPGKFITGVYLIINTQAKEIEFINAGHPLPLIFNYKRKTGYFLDGANNSAVGIFKDENYHLRKLQLEKDELLVLYTDGLIESRRNSLLFGESGLYDSTKKYSALEAQPLADSLAYEARDFAEGKLLDDMAIIVLRF